MNLHLILSLLLFVGLNISYAQNREINFEKGTWEEALEKAKKENKLVFLDAYATWCGPCKWMAKTTFKNDTAADFFNTNFINYKMDMEKGIGPELSKKFQVNAYPTLLIINENSEVVHRTCGALNTQDFVKFGKNALNPETQLLYFEKRYEANRNNPEFLKKYVYTLSTACLKTDEVVKQYFSTQSEKDMYNDDNWRFMRENLGQVTSWEFNFVENHLADYISKFGKEEVEGYLANVYSKELFSRIQGNRSEYNDIKLRLQKSALSYKDIIVDEADLEVLLIDEKYDEYARLALKILNKEKENDPYFVNNVAWNFYEKIEDPQQLKKILPFLEDACKKEPNYALFDTHAAILTKLNSPNARSWIDKAIKQGKTEGADVSETEKLKQKLK